MSQAPVPGTPRYERAVSAIFGSGGYYDDWTAGTLIALIDSDRPMPHACQHTWQPIGSQLRLGEHCNRCGATR